MQNRTIFSTVNRYTELIFQLWSLVAITASEKLKPKENPDDGSPWAQHPFGKDMIKYLYVSKSFEPIETLCHF